ncbi:MAG: hypothetical protein IPL26_19800 [Leptospiraceae bacterium]|nr:hypothetical protein [Leptospiraceae bacterium]
MEYNTVERIKTINRYIGKWEGGRTWKDYFAKLKPDSKINFVFAEPVPDFRVARITIIGTFEFPKERFNQEHIQGILNRAPELVKNSKPFHPLFYVIACTNKTVLAINTVNSLDMLALIKKLYG